jgi:hypothetical protein
VPFQFPHPNASASAFFKYAVGTMRRPFPKDLVIILTFILLSLSAPAFANTSRFFRILKLYEGKTYCARDRDAFVQGNYNSKSDDDNPDAVAFTEEGDRIQTFRRIIHDSCGIDAKKYWGDSLHSRERHFNLGLTGTYADSSKKRSNALMQASDSWDDLSIEQTLSTDYTFDAKNYRQFKNKPRYWFWEAKATISSRIYGSYSEYCAQENLSAIAKFDRKTKNGVVGERASLSPRIGLGRQRPVTPVYQAFEVERALRETGIIHGELSDAAMVGIAQWLATRFAIKNTRDLPDKFISAGLDSILQADTNVQLTALNGYSVHRVKERTDRRLPWLVAGLEFSVGVLEELSMDYYYSSDRMQIDNRNNDEIQFDQENDVGSIGFDWGLPMSDRWFLHCNTSWNPMHINENGIKTTTGLMRLNWDLSLYYLITDRIYFDCIVNSLPCIIIVPLKQPFHLSLGFTFFLEDHISIGLSFDRFYNDNRSRFESIIKPDYRAYAPDHLSSYEEKINLRLNYDF